MKLLKLFPLVLEAVKDSDYTQLTLDLKKPEPKYNKYAGYKGGIVKIEKIENSDKWRVVERKAGMKPYALERLGFHDKNTMQVILDKWAKKNGRNPLPIKG